MSRKQQTGETVGQGGSPSFIQLILNDVLPWVLTGLTRL
jgi:hypothetical protein